MMKRNKIEWTWYNINHHILLLEITDVFNRRIICQPNLHLLVDNMILTFSYSRWLMLLKGELHKAPVTNPQKILDLGTGTGIWALDIAEYEPRPVQFLLNPTALTPTTGNSQEHT
jgi:methylase of polypeptide subunit release factors